MGRWDALAPSHSTISSLNQQQQQQRQQQRDHKSNNNNKNINEKNSNNKNHINNHSNNHNNNRNNNHKSFLFQRSKNRLLSSSSLLRISKWQVLYDRLLPLTATSHHYDNTNPLLDSVISEINATSLLLEQSDDDDRNISPTVFGGIVEILLSTPLSLWSTSQCASTTIITSLVFYILTKKSVLLSNQQTESCLIGLSLLDVHSNSDHTRPTQLDCICAFLNTFHKQLPAQKVSNDFVLHKIIKVLQQQPDSTSSSTTITTTKRLLDVLHTLLQDSKYASAMLASLTTNIDDTGREQTIPNPIGINLLSVLESKLPTSQQCLITTLYALKQVGSVLSPNAVLIEKSIQLSFQEDDDNSLLLLQAMLHTYPTSMRRLLLIESTSTTSLIKLISSKPMAASCCADIIINMPLKQWMMMYTRTGTIQKMHYFGQRLMNCLVQLLQVLLLQQHLQEGQQRSSSSSSSMSMKLCTVILTTIPYHENDKSILTHLAVKLLESIVNMFISNNKRNYVEITSCIVQCMGGKVLPNGETSNMAFPMKVFLSKQHLPHAKNVFQEYLWQSCVNGKGCLQQYQSAMEIISARLRVDPEWVYLNQHEWSRFQQVIASCTAWNDNNSNCNNMHCCADGFMLLEKFFMSRKDNNIIVDLQQVSFVFDLLLQNGDKQSMIPILGIYSSMTFVDWDYLFQHNMGWNHVDHILNLCQYTNDSGSADATTTTIRAHAAKACGNLCTSCLDKSSMYQQMLYTKVMTIMTKCLDNDTNSNVRSMILFCIGNIALTLRCQAVLDKTISALYNVCDTIIHLVMSSTHGKVVTNAIRALGHLSFIFLHLSSCYSCNDDWDIPTFFYQIVMVMNIKIRNAVDLITTKTTSATTGRKHQKPSSWKERSNAKKHAWGACNVLALVLDGPYTIHNGETIHVSQESLVLLVRCLEMDSEKINLAATIAITCIPAASLQVLAHQNGLVGCAIVACLQKIASPPTAITAAQTWSTRTVVATNHLLQHLLASISIFDATDVLKCLTRPKMNVLYDWMVENSVSAYAFEAFAVAFTKIQSGSVVSLQQRFGSRAAERKRLTLESKSFNIGLYTFDDSDDDEL